jgi:hypothetical protein
MAEPRRRPSSFRRRWNLRAWPVLLGAGALIAFASGIWEARASAQTPLEVERDTDTPATRSYRTTGSRIAVGRSVVIERDEEVRDAVIVFGGDVRIEGRVRDGILAVGGNVELGPESDVRGDVTLVGGTLMRSPGARLSGAVNNVAFGNLWPGWFSVRWGNVESRQFWSWLGLAAATARVSILAVLMAFILLTARARVARVGRAAAAEPGRALLVGLAAEVLFVPLLGIASIVLAFTIIGIPLAVVLAPIAIMFGIAAMLLGFTALACRLGEWLEDRLRLRVPSAIFATALGLLIIVGPAFIARLFATTPWPLGTFAIALLAVGAIVEFGVWTMGLGATLMTGFGRWSTSPPPIPT